MKRLIRPSRAAFILCILLGVLLGSGSYTVYYAEGLSYLSDDPRACANCHIMRDQYDGWLKASHHTFATCNDCHTPHTSVFAKYFSKAENGFWHSKGFTLQDFHQPIRLRPHNLDILNDNCLRCHSNLVSQIASHHDHADDSDSADVISCTRCHTQVGHGPK